VFVQTAHDDSIKYVRGQEKEFNAKRQTLDEKRKKSVEDYLRAERPDVKFTVMIHDPGKGGLFNKEATTSIRQLHDGAQGTLAGSGGSASGGTTTGTASPR
jgi:hypothetical protein